MLVSIQKGYFLSNRELCCKIIVCSLKQLVILVRTSTQRSSGFIVSLTSFQKWVAWREKLPWDTMNGKMSDPTTAKKVGWLIQCNTNCQNSWKLEEWFGASSWKTFKRDLLWSPFQTKEHGRKIPLHSKVPHPRTHTLPAVRSRRGRNLPRVESSLNRLSRLLENYLFQKPFRNQ